MNKLEKGIVDESTKCSSQTTKDSPIPQYRLFLPAIAPENDNPIFLLTPLDIATKNHMKTKVHDIVSRMHSELKDL